MLPTKHTLSLSDFSLRASETFDRLAQTGAAEIITVDGEAKAVLLSPAVYDQMTREFETARDVASIRQSMREFAEGKGVPIEHAHKQLRGELLAMKAAPQTKNEVPPG